MKFKSFKMEKICLIIKIKFFLENFVLKFYKVPVPYYCLMKTEVGKNRYRSILTF
jgi:hypothetical protein